MSCSTPTASSATAITSAALQAQISAAVQQKQQQTAQNAGQAIIGLIQQAGSISPAGVGGNIDAAG
jgi:hypothetical protein